MLLFNNMCFLLVDQEKVSDYEMKLMDLDVEQLGIPVSISFWLSVLYVVVT